MLPLMRYEVMRSTDLDEARDIVARIMNPHQLELIGRDTRLNARMHHTVVGGFSISYFQYGRAEVEPEPLKDFFLIHDPLTGASRVRQGHDVVVTTPDTGAVISPKKPVSMVFNENTRRLVVRLERNRLERHLASMLGHELSASLDFIPAMPLSSKAGASWRRLVRFIVAEIDHDGLLTTSPLASAQLEQMLMTLLLTIQPHNYSEALQHSVSPAAPYYVRRAEEFIHANADQPVTIDDLATVSGVSSRSLFAGFRRFRDTTPMRFLKTVRLTRVRNDLLAADPARTSVTDVATRWGFFHLGKFAVDYRRRFGESPSTTLRWNRNPKTGR